MGIYDINDYDYHLPGELIAQEPLANRDSSRMMVLNRKDKSRTDTFFKSFPDYLNPGDLVVMNNTRVIPARLLGTINSGKKAVELLLLTELAENRWVAMVRPGRRLKPGVKVALPLGVEALVEGYADEGLRVISFTASRPFKQLLDEIGNVPLPPYITKPVENRQQYQTIYACKDGSAAAPTAGFHFTETVFEKMKQSRVEKAFITLHIGPGTFQPVKADDVRNHVMHREYYKVEQDMVDMLNRTKSEGGRIVAVGTTVCRVLETVMDDSGLFRPAEGWTDLYIYPGFTFRAVDALLTNFHLPRSSLLLLVSALAGYDLIMEAYREAVKERYRFFSFGDCMFIC